MATADTLESTFAERLMETIEDRIARTPIEDLIRQFGDLPLDPYPYQWAAYDAVAQCIRKYPGPVIVEAAVSAGKTIMISMLARRIMQLPWDDENPAKKHRACVLSRQAEIIDQDAQELWNFHVNNSIFCAGLGNKKSTHYPIVCGSEGTMVNSLFDKLADFAPLFLIIDECHHVNIDDLIESEERMVPDYLKDENGALVLEDGEPVQIGEHKGETYEEMIAAKRNAYTIIIRTLQERCLKVHGCRLRVIGYTGTPYRGVDSIVNEDYETPGFWRKTVIRITTNYLVKVGSVVPTYFGVSSLGYQLDQFASFTEFGAKDFSNNEMIAMQRQILKDKKLTWKIMQEVVELTKERNGVLVTCAGVAHCKEAAAALPDGISYAIITEDTGPKKRMEIIEDAKAGKIKFIFQVNALTTGVNVPLWDTSVILRRIGSLTLLVQLLGRGMRILKDWMIEAGFKKSDHLVLDYSGTMAAMGGLYEDPILEDYVYTVDKVKEDWKECKYGHKNGKHARRCRHIHPNGERCDDFFVYKLCEDVKDRSTGRILQKGCGAKNDTVARQCRCCGNLLIDPNKNLSGEHYTDKDYCDVISFTPQVGNGGSFAIEYQLMKDGIQFKAWEIHWPNSKNPGAKQLWNQFLKEHVFMPEHRATLKACKSAEAVLANVSLILPPKRVTHRKMGSGKDNVYKKVF